MKVLSIKTNYILNVFRVISGAAVGLVTMPYINRVIGAEYIGKVEYVNTIINYFLLFSALGIPMYGIREISKVRDNPQKKAKTLAELLIILGFTSLIGYLLLFGVLYNLNYFNSYKSLILIMSSMIFLTNIGAEWYFQGIEDQLYITLRYVGVRIIMVVLMLLFIKSPQDYNFYAFCIVLTTCGANFLNFFVISKVVLKERKWLWESLNIKRHMKPVLTIFVATISVNIYLQLDYLLIGSIASDKYVGYYSIANKLVRFVIGFITVIGAVMLPRLSFLFQNDKEQYFIYLQRTFTILLLISLPFTIYFLVFAKPIINLIAGKEFVASILTMRLISPLCIIVSMAYFMGFLILYPQNREKIYTFATIISAVFSIGVNFYAINKYQHNGAAVVGVLAEFIAIVIMFLYLKKNSILPNLFDANFFKIVVSGLIMFFSSIIGIYFFEDNLTNFIVLTLLCWVVYVIALVLIKEQEFNEIFIKLLRRTLKKNN
ncbi:MAG: hypothetical protein BGO86_12080 [Chryseobacterium sp. 36-9]|nr:MAG: hypothetical protein BGO86_12080 [Chryseobacterium sp. 36-9]